MQSLVLIDYGSGNIHSARRALQLAAEAAGMDVSVVLSADPDAIARADRLVLPGVGHFADCKRGLEARDGLVGAMEEAVVSRGCAFLGICVGMQLMADFSMEDADARGLGWVHGTVLELTAKPGFRVPHMGWNEVSVQSRHPVLRDLGDAPHAYFVHSYAFAPEDESHVVATTDHGRPVVAAVARDNLIGTQFHPEKSQAVGLQLLKNFLAWEP